MAKTEWYEVPIKIIRDGKEMILPANEVKKGDYVFFLGMKRICDGMIPDDDEEIIYIKFGIDLWPAEMCNSK